MREPSSQIHFDFIAGGIVTTRLQRSVMTAQSIYDFVHRREILVSTFDNCAGGYAEGSVYYAGMLEAVDEKFGYHLLINNRQPGPNDTNYDLLQITFGDLATMTNSMAIYGASGHLTSIRTDADIGRHLYGNLSWKDENIKHYFILDLLENRRWYRYKDGFSLDDDSLIYEIGDTGRLNFGNTLNRTYVCSLPFDDQTQSPVYLEMVDNALKIAIERPDEVCKIVVLPLYLPDFDAYGMQHLVPRTIVDFPYKLFRTFVVDNSEPVVG